MKWTACLFLAIVATGCQKPSTVATAPQDPEPHPESFTNWTTKTELFMEYPPLVSGLESSVRM